MTLFSSVFSFIALDTDTFSFPFNPYIRLKALCGHSEAIPCDFLSIFLQVKNTFFKKVHIKNTTKTKQNPSKLHLDAILSHKESGKTEQLN